MASFSVLKRTAQTAFIAVTMAIMALLVAASPALAQDYTTDIHNPLDISYSINGTGDIPELTWKSSDTNVATVKSGSSTTFTYGGKWYSMGTCTVTPVSAGTTTVTLFAGSEEKDASTVTVTGKHTPTLTAEVPATCTEKGMKAGVVCAAGGETLSGREEIPALGHTVVEDPAVAATCNTAGKTAGTHCGVCGAVLSGNEEIPAMGHTIVEDPAVAATCASPGKTTGYHCSVCGSVIVAQEQTPLVAHTVIEDAAVAPTCTTAGKTAGSHCSVCGAIIEPQEPLAALGHDWGEWKVTTPATADAPGVRSSVCSRDASHVQTEEIPQLNPSSQSDDPDPTVTTATFGAGTYMIAQASKGTAGLIKVAKGTKSYVVHNQVKIGGGVYKVIAITKTALEECTLMDTFTIGTNVAKIGANAFSKCLFLDKIVLKTSKLKKAAFSELLKAPHLERIVLKGAAKNKKTSYTKWAKQLSVKVK